MKILKNYTCVVLLLMFNALFISCSDDNGINGLSKDPKDPDGENTGSTPDLDIYLGADLSYVNEMETCSDGYVSDGVAVDPFAFFSSKGANLVRVRLWHNPAVVPPTLSSFSGYEDVKKTIRKAKENEMDVLLDFHYSDTWADPAKQWIPDAWKDITDLEVLKDSMYNYTFNTLIKLGAENLAPEIVQVGNEINSEMLRQIGTPATQINWARNKEIINSGIQAVRDASSQLNKEIKVMLHIAQPENALWFFDQAMDNEVTDFDYIGISYYPIWSNVEFEDITTAIANIISTFDRELMIVETAYPFTFTNHDNQGNILGNDALVSGFPATPEGQRDYMIALTQATIDAGGKGVVYWEPGWVPNTCQTLFGNGSGWDNAVFFDGGNNNEALPGFEFYNKENYTNN
jgi:arabinogalactan endo-1,4-beta-galactosidase